MFALCSCARNMTKNSMLAFPCTVGHDAYRPLAALHSQGSPRWVMDGRLDNATWQLIYRKTCASFCTCVIAIHVVVYGSCEICFQASELLSLSTGVGIHHQAKTFSRVHMRKLGVFYLHLQRVKSNMDVRMTFPVLLGSMRDMLAYNTITW